MAVWDIRFKKDLKSLDLTWRPNLRISLSSLDNSFDYSLINFSLMTSEIEEVSTVSKKSDVTEGSDSKPAKVAPIKNYSTKFYCATEEGDLLYADWIAEKTADDKVSRVEYCSSIHLGPMAELSRNPFFNDILLSVGGWSFHVWKEKCHVYES
jgi:dynein intermediate chain 3, axonemal